MTPQFHNATILSIQKAGTIVRSFFIQIDPESTFTFQAGQFVALKLKSPDGDVIRYYSIASSPSADNIIELCIAFKPGGAGSEILWNNIQEGSKLEVGGPMGKFLLNLPITRELCFIATGTGIAPLRSMIGYIFQSGISHGPITLIMGNRTEADNLYASEFELLQAQHPDFRFIPTLSRPSPDWTGEQGYVHAVYQKHYADKRPATFYLCGWQEMLKEARNKLEAMGYDRDSIRLESYG